MKTVAAAVLLVAGGMAFRAWDARQADAPAPPSVISAVPNAPPSEIIPAEPSGSGGLNVGAPDIRVLLPPGELVVTQARMEYESGSMRLVVPRLSLDLPVLDGTGDDVLQHGPGLYEYAQTPDLCNTNTSIAAHRDVFGCEFYDLDLLAEGDSLYLIYRDIVFRYSYRSTTIIDPDEWGPICCDETCRITLTTCDPIGTSKHRLIVVGELISFDHYTLDYPLL